MSIKLQVTGIDEPGKYNPFVNFCYKTARPVISKQHLSESTSLLVNTSLIIPVYGLAWKINI